MSSYIFAFDETDTHETPRFDNLTEKGSYWKQMAEHYRTKLRSVRDEFGQCHETNRKIEVELETQLEEYEERITALLSSKDKLETENDDLMEKLEDTVKHTFEHITEISHENLIMKEMQDKMTKYIKDLEKKNAGLEGGKKATCVLLDEYKGSLEEAMEKNCLLQREVTMREHKILTLRRLQDECRDLKGALAITSRDKVFLKQSKLEFEEAQAYAQFMHLIDDKKLQPCGRKPVVEVTQLEEEEDDIVLYKKTNSPQPTFAVTDNVIAKLASYKKFIQGILFGTWKATEQTDSDDSDPQNVDKNINRGKTDIPVLKVRKRSMPPIGISDHYVDMINNLSTRERVSYSINKNKDNLQCNNS